MAISLSHILVEVCVGRQFYKDCIYASAANTFLPIYSFYLVCYRAGDERKGIFIDNSSPCFVLALHTNAVEYSEIRAQESSVGLKWHLEGIRVVKRGVCNKL